MSRSQNWSPGDASSIPLTQWHMFLPLTALILFLLCLPPGCAGNGKSDNDTPQCLIPPVRTKSVTPTFVASYPGSGARLSWKLIRAMTGIMTGDDYDYHGLVEQGEVVAIKTHYPSHTMNDAFDTVRDKTNRVILLIRSPVHSMPSFFSYLFEQQNHFENHSKRAPLDAWIEFRDKSFQRELKRWYEHVEFWMTNYQESNRIVVSYEELTSPKTGPQTMARMGKFLEQVDGVETTSSQDIPCVWEYVVRGKGKKASKRSGGPGEGETYPFTSAQIWEMSMILENMNQKWPELFSIASLYQESLSNVTVG